MREEIINGVSYRIGRLNAKAQWNVVRRLGSVFAAAKPAAKMWLDTAESVQQDSAVDDGQEKPTVDRARFLDSLFDAVGPLARAIGELSDETSDYVIGTCLSAVYVNRVGGTWAVLARPNGQLMFDDLDLGTMLRLVLLVLQENLSDFFPGTSGGLKGAR